MQQQKRGLVSADKAVLQLKEFIAMFKLSLDEAVRR
jgi:hypothetical protein